MTTTATPRTDEEMWTTDYHHELCNVVNTEFAQQLERELAASQAEVERLKKRPFGCKCETLREKVLGDGCDECNKALVIKMLTDERDELEAEVERLQSGFQGSCYCCEPVGEMNQKLQAEVERLKVINADMRNFLSKAIHNEGFNEEQALKFIYQ